jgi:DNA-binding transcriptional ArsR family regulator
MVNNHSEQLDAVFHALADPTRRAMIARLAQSPCGITELAAPFDMTLAAISKHIKVLEGAGLVVRNIQGRNHTCQLDTKPMLGGIEWLRHYEQFWNQRLDALAAALLADEQPIDKPLADTQPADAQANGK